MVLVFWGLFLDPLFAEANCRSGGGSTKDNTAQIADRLVDFLGKACWTNMSDSLTSLRGLYRV